MCWLLPGSFDCFCCPHAYAPPPVPKERRTRFGTAQKYIDPHWPGGAVLWCTMGVPSPFRNPAKAKRAQLCNGISPKGRGCAAVPRLLSYAMESCAKGAEQNLAHSLKRRGGGGSGTPPPPPPPRAELLSGTLRVLGGYWEAFGVLLGGSLDPAPSAVRCPHIIRGLRTTYAVTLNKRNTPFNTCMHVTSSAIDGWINATQLTLCPRNLA